MIVRQTDKQKTFLALYNRLVSVLTLDCRWAQPSFVCFPLQEKGLVMRDLIELLTDSWNEHFGCVVYHTYISCLACIVHAIIMHIHRHSQCALLLTPYPTTLSIIKGLESYRTCLIVTGFGKTHQLCTKIII